jgi:hypothetical protein
MSALAFSQSMNFDLPDSISCSRSRSSFSCQAGDSTASGFDDKLCRSASIVWSFCARLTLESLFESPRPCSYAKFSREREAIVRLPTTRRSLGHRPECRKSAETAEGSSISSHIVIAFVSANCSPRLRPQDPIDCSMIIPGASKSALRRHDVGSTAVTISVRGSPVIVVPVRVVPVRVISVRIIPIIWEWREERETKRVDKDKRSIVTEPIIPIKIPIVETAVEPGSRG